ncbi:MAG: hypothetical protein NT166_00650 [Candidatus Aminicenantes bacterium]|nr:hypothetical protein [Candidatus Aminicenantes bacterium]
MTLCKWVEKDWDVLANAIRKGKCILMRGPETAVANLDGQPKLLSQLLATPPTFNLLIFLPNFYNSNKTKYERSIV